VDHHYPAAVPFDDDAADDVTGFGPPPHPDDRLWRHPSELDENDNGPRPARRHAVHRWPWGLVAGAGTITVMLVGLGALTVGMRDRLAPGRAAAPAAISPIDSGPLASFDSSGLLTDPGPGSPRDVAPSVVRVEGVEDGAGVVVEANGIVLTSGDVVGNLPDVAVTFVDGTTRTGTNIGTDPVTNLAVIDLPGDGFDAARLVAPADLARDDTVICAGVDHDGFRTVSGTVAAARARYQPDDGGRALDGLIQIAPEGVTSPQRLGSAVVDARGAVLAVTTSHDSLWYYATPIDVARKVANQMIETGTVEHAWIGVLSTDADDVPGVELAGAVDDGPAADVLQAGDVVTELDGEPVLDMSTLVGIVQMLDPGDQVEVTYERRGSSEQATLELAPLPPRGG